MLDPDEKVSKAKGFPITAQNVLLLKKGGELTIGQLIEMSPEELRRILGEDRAMRVGDYIARQQNATKEDA